MSFRVLPPYKNVLCPYPLWNFLIALFAVSFHILLSHFSRIAVFRFYAACRGRSVLHSQQQGTAALRRVWTSFVTGLSPRTVFQFVAVVCAEITRFAAHRAEFLIARRKDGVAVFVAGFCAQRRILCRRFRITGVGVRRERFRILHGSDGVELFETDIRSGGRVTQIRAGEKGVCARVSRGLGVVQTVHVIGGRVDVRDGGLQSR